MNLSLTDKSYTIDVMPPSSDPSPDFTEPDFVDELLADLTARDARAPRLAELVSSRREILLQLTQRRVDLGMSQARVAAAMDTSQPVIARLENRGYDVKLSTLQRYADALGLDVNVTLVEKNPEASKPQALTPSSSR